MEVEEGVESYMEVGRGFKEAGEGGEGVHRCELSSGTLKIRTHLLILSHKSSE